MEKLWGMVVGSGAAGEVVVLANHAALPRAESGKAWTLSRENFRSHEIPPWCLICHKRDYSKGLLSREARDSLVTGLVPTEPGSEN